MDAFSAAHRGGSGSPLVLLHGFTDTWRTWELILPALELRHDVLAPTLPGHAGGPPLREPVGEALADAVEEAMDGAGWETAHVAGNSLGGYVAHQLAERGRARTATALAPAGGWAPADASYRDTLAYFEQLRELLAQAAPFADALVATPEGRRRATAFTTTNYEHIPAELLAHQIRGAAACAGAPALIEAAHAEGWPLDPERITCPVRIAWGTEDRILPWPEAAAGFRDALPQAEWVVLDGIGHCPQLDIPAETADLIEGFATG
jgi:pimeloyl-ACP methyl ester carboxylesterase